MGTVRRNAGQWGAAAAAVALLASCQASTGDGAADEPIEAVDSATAAASTPDETPTAAKSPIDLQSEPDYHAFPAGWPIGKFPIPAGSKPVPEGFTADSLNAYLVFEGADVKELSAFYELALADEAYQLNVDVYGAVRFLGEGVEGAVVRDQGDKGAVVVFQRKLS